MSDLVKFRGVVICAHCVAHLYRLYERGGDVRIREGDQVVDGYRMHPSEVLQAIRKGSHVEVKGTMEALGPAVTTIDGTAVCGWHGYVEMQRRPR